jgi:diguanylate cyclase (GGDEF)-like protein
LNERFKFQNFKEELYNVEGLKRYIAELEKLQNYFKKFKEDIPLPKELLDTLAKINGGIDDLILSLNVVSELEKDPVSKIAIIKGYFKKLYEDRLIERAISDKKDIFVLGIDVFELKRVNNAYGHSIGDLYLSKNIEKVVYQLEERFNNYLPVRWGGDEYVFFILPENEKELEEVKNLKLENKIKILNPFCTNYSFSNENFTSIEGGFRYYIKQVDYTPLHEEFKARLCDAIYKALDKAKKQAFE